MYHVIKINKDDLSNGISIFITPLEYCTFSHNPEHKHWDVILPSEFSGWVPTLVPVLVSHRCQQMRTKTGTIAPEADTQFQESLVPNTDKGQNDDLADNTPDNDAVVAGDRCAHVKNEEEKEGDAATPDIEGATALHPPCRPVHPPSLFTNDRGNLKAVSFVVRNPCRIFWLLIATCIALSFLLQVMVFRTAKNGIPFTAPSNEFDLDDLRSVQYDSYRLARDEVSEARNDKTAMEEEEEEEDKQVLKQSEIADIAYWVFESETPAGVFGSEAAIRGMKEAYEIFLGDPKFRDWCVLDYQTPLAANATEDERGCRAPMTPLAMYYASEWDGETAAAVIEELKDPAKMEKFNSLALCLLRGLYCELLPLGTTPRDRAWAMQLGANISSIISTFDMKGALVENYTQVTELASYVIQVDVFKGFVDFGFDKGFSASNPVSRYSRGLVFWGGPLEPLNETSSPEEENARSARMRGGKAGEEENTDADRRKAFIMENYLDRMNAQSEESKHSEINSYYLMTTIIGDVILSIVTKDALLAIFSFAFVFFWLRINTKSWFLAFVGFFEIFFSIPIAWFLFSVVFRIKYFATLNSLALFVVAAIGADDIFIFMDAYNQSQYKPEILVDLETRMSWVYRRTGSAMAITSATTCAAFLCTLITPLASLQSFGIFAAVVIFIDYVLVMTLFCTAVVIYHNQYENRSCCACGSATPSSTEQARIALKNNDGAIKMDRVSEFFKTKVAGFIKVPMNRLILGVVFLAWLGIATWQATLLEATKESEQFLDENHPLQKSLTIIINEFPTADDDEGLKVYYIWGVGEVNRAGVNRLIDPENYGSPTFVPEFDFNEQCQTDLLSFCDKLKTDPQYSDLIKRKEGLGQVNCFIEELGAYNVGRSGEAGLADCDYVRKREWNRANITWQVNPNDLPGIMADFLQQKTCFGGDRQETISARYQNEIGWDGSTLRYAAVSAESNILGKYGRDSEMLTRNEYEQFVAIAEEQGAIISESCSGETIMTDLTGKFVFMNNQALYVESAVQSAVLGVAIAFVVLLLSTRVFHLAFFASLSIVSVLASVLGTMVMLGWYLGSIESTLIGIIAGFSVDYVVHLAHAYGIAKGNTYTRITEAFGDLGISVFNGMLTSVVASLPLFFCQLQFFAKFGTFLGLTITFSWIFANFGFMSILGQLRIPLREKGNGFHI